MTNKAFPSFPEPNKMGGWSSLQTLTHTEKSEDDVPYVHPLVKLSKFAMTEKGMNTCTEILGCETGSDMALSDFPVPSPKPYQSGKAKGLGREEREPLPPPLHSISGVHMECVREGGKLLIMAVATVPAYSCFEAQRDNGRLTLRFTQEREEEGKRASRNRSNNNNKNCNNNNNNNNRNNNGRCNEEKSNIGDLLFNKAFWVATS